MLMASFADAAAMEVVATIRPVHGIVTAVMGELGRPRLLSSGMTDPHHHSLRPSEARALARADAIFAISLDMEAYLRRARVSLDLGDRLVELARAAGVRLLPRRRIDPPGISGPTTEGVDWHVWTDADNVIAMARAVANRLAALDPANAETYAANAARMARRVTSMDAVVARRMRPLAGRPFILVHDATQYFERRYGLAPLAVLQPDDETPPGPRRLAAIVTLARTHTGSCVLTPHGAAERWARTLANEADAHVTVVDVLGTGLAHEHDFWPALLDSLAKAYESCLLR